MHTSMTATAKRLQVIKSVVSLLLNRCCSVSVNVVNLQVAFAAAVLACITVAQKSCVSISAKIVIVSGFFSVRSTPFCIRGKPFVYFANFCASLALRASVLWARFINKIFAAFGAVKNSSFGSDALIKPHFTQRLCVLLAAVFRLARFANFLGRAGWNVVTITNSTGFGGVWHKRPHIRLFHILA